MADDNKDLKAGHPPAVKAGGMRIVQHKTPHQDRTVVEDNLGLSTSPNLAQVANEVSGVQTKGMVDYPQEAVQAMHKPPPPQQFQIKHTGTNIHQPRKQ